jgi:3'-5' exoribonuclease
MFLGGFFHDVGKIWELSYDRTTDYTTEGKLIGHLVMGVELIERKIAEIESIPGRLPGKFPIEKRLLAKHVVLAHHGEYEYGSPKRPKCLEALLVHYVDDLDSKVNAIGKFIEADPSPGEFTQLNKLYGRFFFKPEWARKEAGPSA